MSEETPREFLNWIRSQKDLKIVTQEMRDFSLIDVGIKSYGGDTGIYLKNVAIQERMRRGLTFLERDSVLEIARQGLPKFYDYDKSFLDLESKACKISKFSFPITVYNLEKLNGENAQISWSPLVNEWIICSKNVCIAASSLTEATNLYATNPRYTYALHIAKHWFQYTLPTLVDVDGLKDLLSKNTLIGEVVDLENAQHIVDNPARKGLIFFALVTKDRPSAKGVPLCTMPDMAIPIFQRHSLKHVNVGESCVLESTDTFEKLEEFISHLTVDKCPNPYVCLSEGSVIYATNSHNDVLFLAKIKTTKYRILRRLREVMKRVASKNILPGSDEEAKIRKGFSGDIHKWGFSDKYDVYIHLFDAACATRLRDDWTADKIGTRFIDFLHAIIATGKKTQPSLPPRILDGEEQVPEDGESSAQEDDDFFRQSTWMSVHSQSRRKKGHTRR